MFGILKKLFPDKKTKDVEQLLPIVDEILAEYEKLSSLSDEQLKQKTNDFKQKIQDDTSELRAKIDELNEKLKSDDEFDRQAIYDELDTLNDELNDKYEEVLDEILPQAFAVVKDTCRRLLGKSYTVMGHKEKWMQILIS